MRDEPIVIEQEIHAPVERVWKAITDREEIRHWFFDISRFWPEIGCDFQFSSYKNGKKYIHLCQITDVVERRRLAYSCRFEGFNGGSEIIFELTPADKRTLVRFIHKGISSFPDTEKAFSHENFLSGWENRIRKSLKDFAERENLNKSIKINAYAGAVWQALTDPEYTKEWLSAFNKGTTVESDWQEGSDVIWRDGIGNVVAQGIVTVNHPEYYLKIAFPCYDENSCTLNPGGDYQLYMLTAISDNQTFLEVESDTYSEHTSMLNSLWEGALKKIKTISEKIAKKADMSVLYY